MATLKELYALIDGIQKVGLPVSEEFLKSADELEEKIIKEDILPALSQIIEPQLKEIQRDLVLVVEHHPGEPLRVALSRKANIREIIRETLNAKSLTSVSDAHVIPSTNPISTGNGTDNGKRHSRHYRLTQQRYAGEGQKSFKRFASYFLGWDDHLPPQGY